MNYEAPIGPVETALAEIWAEILGLERVGRHDNFFELGGHSLLAIYMLERMRLASLNGDLRALFDAPVLSHLAADLDSPGGGGESAGQSIAPVRRDGPLVPSFAQQRLWFLAQMEGASEAYHIFVGLRLKGGLDQAALRRALDRIVARHEALRTTFHAMDGEMFQRVAPHGEFALSAIDLEEMENPDAAIREQAEQERAQPFDLEKGPLIRGRLLRLSEEDHALLITMHHIVSDGWSVGVFLRELSLLYRAYRSGGADPLAPLPVQYADYAAWQRQSLDEDLLTGEGRFWKRALAGAPALLELPADRRRPEEQDFAGDTVPIILDEALTTALHVLSQRHGLTLFMTVLAGWALVLSRLSSQEEVVIGVPAANRGRLEIEDLIGFFVNTLALRIGLGDSRSVAELLERVKVAALEAQTHQALPFEQVVDLLKPARSLAHTPLFQVMFAWQNNDPGMLDFPGLDASRIRNDREPAKLDLTLELRESDGRIIGGLNYATALFGRATVARHAGYLRGALAAMAADDMQAAAAVPILSPEERHLLLVTRNATYVPVRENLFIHQMFEAQAERQGASPAIVSDTDSLSYGELNQRANRLAHYLRLLGVKPDDPVAICVDRSPEMVVGLLAVLKAGGAYVPLDPAYPAERLAFMLKDSMPAIILTDGPARTSLNAAMTAAGIAAKILDLKADAHDWTIQPAFNPAPDGLQPGNLAYTIYTSGSTGTPKGVMVEHRGVTNFHLSMAAILKLKPDDRLLAVTSLSFDIAGLELFTPLSIGAAVMIAPRPMTLDGNALGTALDSHRITVMQGTPAMWRLLKETRWRPQRDFKALCGGEAVPADVEEYLKNLESEAFNLYGPTETTIWSMTAPIQKGLALSVGHPIWNTRIYLLDAVGSPVPDGAAGEIHIGGLGVARGYSHRPDLTAERFVNSPFVEGDRLYRTGDLARYRSDGSVEFLGRNDFQVKLRGFRIELGEIETRLHGHPGVREAIVVAREDEPGNKRLAAYYVSDSKIAAEELRAHLAASLPEYMVPAAYVRLEILPLTPNGKINRKALPEPSGEAFGRRSYIPPIGPVEIALARIWQEVLGVEQVGRHDNFFELGGHSLLAVRVLERMRRAGLSVDVRTIFATPVLSAIAARVPAPSLS